MDIIKDEEEDEHRYEARTLLLLIPSTALGMRVPAMFKIHYVSIQVSK